MTILLARSVNRRLAGLRRSALTLAQEQLPAVVSRLRRGETVDVAAEAPPLRAGSDEIGQVGEAIDTVRQVAIRSAVEEARVRQGVNDMFRNLARRNQSLLQRQLSVLDGMERRATDPDVLEDLFKMDHLTTRMRRHAEGLIILSGAAPGRSWSAPVKVIDVMRGAVAEVEDYARVTVTTQSRAALAGSAVTDVIHLLAELIENATTLSPPFTQVRVTGENVANGFAIEIEDRGLGMVPQRMQELNERLANPPDINPANTEQLGLFVVGQLARRHGIRVMLRTSPYGGTTAVALLPQTLIVEEGPAAITAGGRAPAAASAGAGGARGANGNGAFAGSNGSTDFAGGGAARASGAFGGPFATGPGAGGNRAGVYADRGGPAFAGGANGNARATGPGPGAVNGNGYAGAAADATQAPWSGAGEWVPGGPSGAAGDPESREAGFAVPSASASPTSGSVADPGAFGRPAPFEAAPYDTADRSDPPPGDRPTPGYPVAGPREARALAPEPGLPSRTAGPDAPGVRVSGTLRPPTPAPGPPGAPSFGSPGFGSPGPAAPAPAYGPGGPATSDLPTRRPGGRPGGGDVPVVTGVPVGRTATPPSSPPPEFDVFSPIQRPDQGPGEASYESPYGTAYRPGGQPPAAGGVTDLVSAPGQPGPSQPGPSQPGPSQPGPALPGMPGAGRGPFTGGHPYQDNPPYPGTGPYPAAGAYPGDGPGVGRPAPAGPQVGFPAGPSGPGGPASPAGPGGAPDDEAARLGWADQAGDGPGEDGGDFKGLPRRVRQANLAPQLRSATTSGAQGPAVPQATAASLADMRNTLSAMQRGWQQGRSQVQRDTEGEPDGD